MRHRVAGRHLGRDTAHRTALFRNLVTDLLRHERIVTTEAKAKEIRPMAERIVTLARRGDVHSRRLALRFVYDPKVVRKAFDDIGPRMKDRPGGYLRITALEPRKGDGAKMAAIEFVDYVDAPPTARPQRVTAAPTAVAAPVIAPAAPEPETGMAAQELDTIEDMPMAVEGSAEAAAEFVAEEHAESARAHAAEAAAAEAADINEGKGEGHSGT